MVIGKGSCDRALSESEVRELMSSALFGAGLDGKRVLVIIPDGTRTAPIPMMFRLFHESLNDRVEALDFLIALGTHQPMSEEAICERLEISTTEHQSAYRNVRFFNHAWDNPAQLKQVGFTLEMLVAHPQRGYRDRGAPSNTSHQEKLLDYA